MIAWPKLARLARPFGTVMFPRTLFGKLPTRHQQGDLCPVWSARAATKKWDWKAVQITALQWTCHSEDHLKESIHINPFSNCVFLHASTHQDHLFIFVSCFVWAQGTTSSQSRARWLSFWTLSKLPCWRLAAPWLWSTTRLTSESKYEFLWKGFDMIWHDMIEDIVWVESMVIES